MPPAIEPLELEEEKADELFRKFGAGILEGGRIKIHPLEALYFMEKGKLSLEGETFDSLFGKIKSRDSLAEEKYAVLRQLRKNGYIVRPSFADEPWVRVYRKGFRPGEDRTAFLLRVVKSGIEPGLGEIAQDAKKAAEVRKELIYAFMQEGKIVFIKAGRTTFD